MVESLIGSEWMSSPSWKTDLQKTLRLVRSDRNHKKPPVKAALYTEYGKHKSSSGSMMPSSRLFTAFCTLPVGAKRTKRCSCTDNHTLS